MSKDREELRKGCSDSIIVCVSKYPYYMGKDKFSNDKNICLICGKEVNYVKKDTIVIDMSSYDTGFSNAKDDIECKLYHARYEYINIIKINPNISKDDLNNELNRRISIIKTDDKKTLEKKIN